MHAKMRLNESVGTVLRYHERKIRQGQAECLYAANMLKETEQLSRKEKQWHFERLNVLNERVRRKTLQLFLSWPKEDVLDNDKMRRIGQEYVREMGLGQQPYLIYRHRDTANPHAHIVTSNIRPDRTRIHLWRREMLHSLRLSRELEIKYGLCQTGKRVSDEEWSRRYPVQKVVYGVTPLKPTMDAVIEHVVPAYKYTTIDELNALLRPYNIRATQGREESITRRNNGLLYFPINSQGDREQVYVKASDLRIRPTMKYLQERFVVNDQLRQEHRQRLTTAIDWVLYKQPVSKEALRQALQKERISMVEESDSRGGPRHVYYIDQLAKTVFDGRTLGRAYSSEGLDERCVTEDEWRQRQVQKQEQKQQHKQRLRQRPKLDHY